MRDLGGLTSLVAVSGIIFNGLTFYAVIVLRRRYPTMERPYKVWLYPYLIWAVIAVMVGLLVSTLLEDPFTAMLNLIVPAIALAIFKVFFEKSSEEAARRRSESRIARPALAADD